MLFSTWRAQRHRLGIPERNLETNAGVVRCAVAVLGEEAGVREEETCTVGSSDRCGWVSEWERVAGQNEWQASHVEIRAADVSSALIRRGASPQEQELACDDAVVMEGVAPAEYADLLLESAPGRGRDGCLVPIQRSGSAL